MSPRAIAPGERNKACTATVSPCPVDETLHAARALDETLPALAPIRDLARSGRHEVVPYGNISGVTEHPADYLQVMVRRRPPAGAPVVSGSTPVVAFGDPSKAEVATLAINPSRREFTDADGQMLTGDRRRLATLESLGASDLESLTNEQVATVVAECADYFAGNPYWQWFDALDRVVHAGLGASFYDGTACHLDLVQWATDPVWSHIPDRQVRQALLDDGVGHLAEQLRRENIRLVLLNGREVINQVQRTRVAELAAVDSLTRGATSCTLYAGEGAGARFLGWSTNLQGSFGVSREFKAALSVWLAEQEAPAPEPDGHLVDSTPAEQDPLSSEPSLDQAGYLAEIVEVHGKQEFTQLVDRWLDTSGADTIGDVGSFGGRPCVRILLPAGAAVLNVDTKRTAVREYLDQAQRHGADMAWRVVANQRGRVNKIVIRDDGGPTPGWFCYLTQPLDAPGEV